MQNERQRKDKDARGMCMFKWNWPKLKEKRQQWYVNSNHVSALYALSWHWKDESVHPPRIISSVESLSSTWPIRLSYARVTREVKCCNFKVVWASTKTHLNPILFFDGRLKLNRSLISAFKLALKWKTKLLKHPNNFRHNVEAICPNEMMYKNIYFFLNKNIFHCFNCQYQWRQCSIP